MKISVIIPSYKPGEYISECLDSLRHQTLDKTEFEVIIILNGCRDPWYGRIAEYIEQNNADNFHLIQTDRPGVGNARNLGLDRAQGDYIAFIDDDDYVSPGYLSALLEGSTPETVAFSDSRAFMDGEKKWIDTYKQHLMYQRCREKKDCSMFETRSVFNGPCMKLIHKSIIGRSRFSTAFKVGEDSIFMFDISKNIGYVQPAAPEAIYYRRFRDLSATTTKRSRMWRIRNSARMFSHFCMSYIKSPLSYNLPFFISRCLATVKTAIL